MNPTRKIVPLWVLCLLFIVLVLILRTSQKIPVPPEISASASALASLPATIAQKIEQKNQDNLSPSHSFYSTNDGDVASATSVYGEKNTPAFASATTSSTPSTIIPKEKPSVTAASYLVGNVKTGKIYLEKNASMRLPVASMSKLITAIESIDTISSSTMITIDPSMLEVYGDSSNLKAGETFTLKEILYPLLLNSSNIAAEALASSSDRMKFINAMPGYAWEIGMPSTHFADPSGISPSNISTASDFFALARYLYKDRPDVLSITRIASVESATTTEHGHHDFVSIHPFVKDPNFLGGKTGHTPEAKDTMLTMMLIKDQPIAVIVLSSENRKADTDYLLAAVSAISDIAE